MDCGLCLRLPPHSCIIKMLSMGHSDIAVTLNVYTHIGLDDATEELRKLEEMENARRELEKGQEKPVSKKMFKAI